MPNSRSSKDLVDFIRSTTELLIGHDNYELHQASVQSCLIIEIQCSKSDYPILTGRGGQNIEALRTLVKQLSIGWNLPRVQVELIRFPDSNSNSKG